MEIYRIRSVNKKLVIYSNSCQVAAGKNIENDLACLAPRRGYGAAGQGDGTGIVCLSRVICLLFMGRPVKRK